MYTFPESGYSMVRNTLFEFQYEPIRNQIYIPEWIQNFNQKQTQNIDKIIIIFLWTN